MSGGVRFIDALLQWTDPATHCYADTWPHVSDTSHKQRTRTYNCRGKAQNIAMLRLAFFAIDSDFNCVARREAAGGEVGLLPPLELANLIAAYERRT